MSRARIYLKNLTANWIGYGASLLIMFFMSPFVVHTLGDVQYGVWSLMMSLTGYLGLVELGTRAGIGRFINYYLGKEDPQSVNEIISTGLAIIAAMGVLLLTAAIALACTMHLIFPKIPAELLPSTRIICLLIVANLWLGFFSSPFRNLIQAYERFELTNAVDLIVLAVRTGGTIWALVSGYGLVTLAVVQVAGSIVGQVGVQLLAQRLFPKLTIRRSLVSVSRFRELFGFSIWAFIGAVAYKLLYSADTIVIAILLGPKWITYYAIGGMLLYKSRDLIGQATTIFSPKIMQDCAREDWAALQIQFRRGGNLAMGIGILLLVGMITFGREFIILWMGPRFAVSYTILTILAISSFPAVATSVAAPVYSGLHRVKLHSLLTLLQGLANLGLTLLFVMGFGMGIEGVAWGTFGPRIVIAIVAGIIAMRWLRIDTAEFCRTIALRWCVLTSLFFTACFAINSLPWALTWGSFFLKVVLATGLYLAFAWTILSEGEERSRVRDAIRRNVTIRMRRVRADTIAEGSPGLETRQ